MMQRSAGARAGVRAIVGAAALAAACKGGEEGAADREELATGAQAAALVERSAEEKGAAGAAYGGGAAEADRAKGGAARLAKQEAPAPLADAAAPVAAAPAGNVGGLRARVPEGPTRAWFPETFLFQPLVVTDAAGTATVRVRVPDRLTTWRVLALGHTRTGAQGGAVTSFLGTLPAYVDPVVPPFLVAGDEVRLPVQLVNTTEAPVTGELAIEARGAALTAPRGPRTLPPRGSLVEYATLRAERPGRIELRAGLGATDAVERTIEVLPAGRPVTVARSGTLAAPRALSFEGPAGTDPASDRARLMVFPGALALLRAELAASLARGGVADDAYALLLAGRAPELLTALGDTADPDALRELAIVAGQRAIRHARALDLRAAIALAPAALAHPQRPILARLGERAAAQLQREQRPDGTFGGGAGETLQRVLVTTAEAARAVAAAGSSPAARQRAQGVAVRAAGAFERNLDAVTDGYTAAAILAAGALRGPAAEALRARVHEAIGGEAGGRWLAVPAGVVRADGAAPGRSEATALAVLALEGDAAAAPLLADLGATLLAAYDPVRGWGDGAANLACIQAVLALFRAPLPPTVTVTLARDGARVASGTFDRRRLRDVLVLEAPAPGLAGAHAWTITAEPAVPGLGFSLALTAHAPWERDPAPAGLELALPARVEAAVGEAVALRLTAAAPAGLPLHITHALPAGVQVDRPSLEALVAAGALARFEVADGVVELYPAAAAPGQVVTLEYRAIPTLAGALQSGASRIRAGGRDVHVPPARWTVAPVR